MRDFEGVRTQGRKVVALKVGSVGGAEGILPEKVFQFRVLKKPFPAFSAGHFP